MDNVLRTRRRGAQDEMMFDAGQWFAFGTEMLELLVVKSEADARAMGDVDHSRNSLVSDTTKLGFIPGYTVVVRDECTFLVITAHSWVLACRSTLMSRGGTRPSSTGMDGLTSGAAGDEDSPWQTVEEPSKRTSLVSPQILQGWKNRRGTYV
ncbi:hypothetical protein GCK32_014163 [Trichostrongylus colubriformis]|uniref:Uncharacterized protein n=1 Tax=Trichostrongylus colubriformis TaxID=6319 RepID=A0AAN8F7L3_TRICO